MLEIVRDGAQKRGQVGPLPAAGGNERPAEHPLDGCRQEEAVTQVLDQVKGE